MLKEVCMMLACVCCANVLCYAKTIFYHQSCRCFRTMQIPFQYNTLSLWLRAGTVHTSSTCCAMLYMRCAYAEVLCDVDLHLQFGRAACDSSLLEVLYQDGFSCFISYADGGY